jgi:hypothetical protein
MGLSEKRQDVGRHHKGGHAESDEEGAEKFRSEEVHCGAFRCVICAPSTLRVATDEAVNGLSSAVHLGMGTAAGNAFARR